MARPQHSPLGTLPPAHVPARQTRLWLVPKVNLIAKAPPSGGNRNQHSISCSSWCRPGRPAPLSRQSRSLLFSLLLPQTIEPFVWSRPARDHLVFVFSAARLLSLQGVCELRNCISPTLPHSRASARLQRPSRQAAQSLKPSRPQPIPLVSPSSFSNTPFARQSPNVVVARTRPPRAVGPVHVAGLVAN